uniref:Uncharacterized protein n=1 Tax=Sphaerodactylus townsendi TaxID=933632 RepID=A0ACB8G550_9SAUR
MAEHSEQRQTLEMGEVSQAANNSELRAELHTLQRRIDNLTWDRGPHQSSNGPNATPPQHSSLAELNKGPWKGFKVDFVRDPNKLAFFLIQVGSYMEVHGEGFQSDHERIFEIGTQLHEEAANWLVGLVEEDAPEIYDLEQFLLALHHRFEDPLAEEKARTTLQQLRQGNHSVSDFAAEFCRLASRLQGWPELVLVQLFKDALHPKVLQWGLIQGDPETLMGWIKRDATGSQG